MTALLPTQTTLDIACQHIAAVKNFAKDPNEPENVSAVFVTAGMLAGQALLCDRLLQERNEPCSSG